MFKHTIFSIKSLPVGWTQALDLANDDASDLQPSNNTNTLTIKNHTFMPKKFHNIVPNIINTFRAVIHVVTY